MESPDSSPDSKKLLWAGWIVTILPVFALTMSGVMKLVKPAQVVEGMAQSGWPEHLALGLGIVELGCTLLYAIPRTAVLGAILVTGYLGGAIATHVRVEEPFVPPAVLGVLVWLGLFLRDRRLRELLPLRS